MRDLVAILSVDRIGIGEAGIGKQRIEGGSFGAEKIYSHPYQSAPHVRGAPTDVIIPLVTIDLRLSYQSSIGTAVLFPAIRHPQAVWHVGTIIMAD